MNIPESEHILYANSFVSRVRNEEKLAIIRAKSIKKKYLEIRKKTQNDRIDLILRTSKTDEELAKNLQLFYYT